MFSGSVPRLGVEPDILAVKGMTVPTSISSILLSLAVIKEIRVNFTFMLLFSHPWLCALLYDRRFNPRP